MDNARKVVVTGGAGFIGSHLVGELSGKGYHVIVIDDLSNGKEENIAPLLGRNGKVEFVKGSITDLPLLQKLFRGVYHVFHLAALTSVPRSMESPQLTHEINGTGTLNVLMAARYNHVGKVVYAASCAVYGDTAALPLREDMLPNPLSPYAASKLAGEYYCRVFQLAYALPTACLRFFNVYGPRQDPDSQYAAVVPRFINRIAGGNPPLIFGDGKQTRDFVFVKDVIEANILVAESGCTGVYNIGSGEQISINRLAQLITKLAGYDIKPSHENASPGDVVHSVADISRAGSFGYRPKYSQEEGLKLTMQEFR